MILADDANLIYKTETLDDDGYPSQIDVKIPVLVKKKSVTRAEFYTAMRDGIKPEVIFEMWLDDFDLTKHIVNNKALYADHIEYDGAIYEIIRTYSQDGIKIELTCS